MSLSRSQQRLVLIGGVAVALVICGAILLPALARPSNCGGNSAALAACQTVSLCFQLIADERGDAAVSIHELNENERGYFKHVSGLNWIGPGRVLVTTERVGTDGATGKAVIAVCDKPFDNVPRRLFGKAPLAHAVAYADGHTSLISTDEFQRLDLSGFVDARTIGGTSTNAEPAGGANESQPSRPVPVEKAVVSGLPGSP